MTVLTQQKHADPRDFVLSVSFMKIGKLYYFDYTDFPDLALGDHVIVGDTRLGDQMGEIKAFQPRSALEDSQQLLHILRPATPADLLLNQQWKAQEVPALIECRQAASEMGGFQDVKFVAAEYNYNGTVLTFLFTTEEKERINTNRLRNVLQKQFDVQIEFRQVGPRDVAKVQEGFGACGIPRCCSTFLTEFSMISISMAKAQGISLNPSEITGMCGRLRCCLLYEYEQYVEARKHLPKVRKRIGTPHGMGRVVEVHPLRDGVTVEVDENYHFVTREEITPLEEWEALKQAAASPCSKNEGGGCDCGAKRPRGDAKQTLNEMGFAVEDEEFEAIIGAEISTEDTASEGEAAPSAQADREPRHSHRRHRKSKKQHAQPSQPSTAPDNTAESSDAQGSQLNQGQQARRNRRHKRGHHGRNRKQDSE